MSTQECVVAIVVMAVFGFAWLESRWQLGTAKKRLDKAMSDLEVEADAQIADMRCPHCGKRVFAPHTSVKA